MFFWLPQPKTAKQGVFLGPPQIGRGGPVKRVFLVPLGPAKFAWGIFFIKPFGPKKTLRKKVSFNP